MTALSLRRSLKYRLFAMGVLFIGLVMEVSVESRQWLDRRSHPLVLGGAGHMTCHTFGKKYSLILLAR
jgi:hypothetical protein